MIFVMQRLLLAVTGLHEKPDAFLTGILKDWDGQREEALGSGCDPAFIDDMNVTVERLVADIMTKRPGFWFPDKPPKP